MPDRIVIDCLGPDPARAMLDRLATLDLGVVDKAIRKG
jgi:hypothetical protein